jgi:competence protein ComEC
MAVLAVLGQARLRMALLAALLLGFGLAKLRVSLVETPALNHAVVAHLTGRIESLELREHGERVVLENVRSGVLSPVPQRVRVALRAQRDLHPGD